MSKKHRKPKQAKHQAPKTAQPDIAAAAPNLMQEPWPALTGLRGLAAFGVLCMHSYLLAGRPESLPRPLSWLFAMGWSGVDVFFTLSAFLLTVPFVTAAMESTPSPNLRVFAWRRVLRIVPAYYVQIAILLTLGALGLASTWAWNAPTVAAVLAHLVFYIQVWPIVPAQLPPWWTLPVEMGFYLLLPLFALCLRPRRWPWLLLAIAASLGYRYGLLHAGLNRMQIAFWVENLPGRLHQFLVGMLAAYAFVKLKSHWTLPRPGKADALALAASIVFLLLPALGYPITGSAYEGGQFSDPLLLSWHLYASVVVAVLLVALVAGAPRMARVFSWPPLRGLGLISYGLYLWHYPLMLGLRAELGGYEAIRADFWPFYFYSVLISVLVAMASWWMIERPAQQWGRRGKLTV